MTGKKTDKKSKPRKKKTYAGKWTWVFAVLALFFFMTTVVLWTERPMVTTTIPTTTLTEMDNDLFFGWNYKDDYQAHRFICETCCCDESRKDYIYVSNGFVEFDIMAIPGQTNVLTLAVGNLNENCRKNDVYIDGFYAGNLDKETNGTLKTDFKFNVTPTQNRIHVKVEHISTEEDCWWGNDLKRARVDLI